jgi:L-threonylcarbamoyladenylate synthase
MVDFENDIVQCLKVLHGGGLILYPTDTVWGIGCDAINKEAVEKVFRLKQRPDQKAMIVLVADERDILQYVAGPDPGIFSYLEQTTRPTTVIYDGAIGLAENLLGEDGSIGIRICQEQFCRHLIRRFRKPLVSTSANISGAAVNKTFATIPHEIIEGVDYVVNYRRDDHTETLPSAVIRWNNGKVEILR